MAGLQKLMDWKAVDTATPLSKDLIHTLLTGHEISGYQSSGGEGTSDRSWWRRFDDDNKAHSQAQGYETNGFYNIEGKKICVKWENGDADCWEIRQYPEPTPGYRNDYIGIDDDGIVWSFSVTR